MGDPRQFNGMRAAFWLVAFILGFQCLVVLISLGACVYWSEHIVEGKTTCAAREMMGELLSQALAAALAFAGGYANSKRKNDADD
jgi:hypothetical protein